MKKYLLDKIFAVGTTYRAEEDKAYVITKAGTDSSSQASIKVAGTPVFYTITDIAPKYKIGTNLLGPMHLGSDFIVVPPSKTLEFTGASGSEFRLIGEIIELEAGEAITPDLASRYTEQGKKFLSYESGTYSHGADTAWTAGDENTVIEATVPSGEKWLINNLFLGKVDNVSGGLSQGQFAFRIYVDDKPFDLVETSMGKKGIDVMSCYLPPNTTNNMEPFTLEKMPIELTSGRTLKVTCINVSGSDISPTSGNSLDVTCYVVKEITYV